MFYEPRKGHGLPHNPSKAIVSPRPIGWISTRNRGGALNLAPYSFFNMAATDPFLVWFSSEGEKDSVNFARDSGEFVANLVSRNLAVEMNKSSVDAPAGISEFGYSGLTPAESRIVKAPRVKEAYAALECRLTDISHPRALDGDVKSVFLVTGEVVGVHIDEAVLTDGLFDVAKAGNVARLGYMDYTAVTEVFSMIRPRWEKA